MDNASKEYLTKLLNMLSYKSDFTDFDQAFLDSVNSKNIITYVKENFKLVYAALNQARTLKNYLILKIEKFIQLEHVYSLQGYDNTANIELATADITTEIKIELHQIEKFIKNPAAEKIDLITYDLDENPYIESISE